MPQLPDSSMPVILSCTDGSAYAASVYDHSAWAARRTGASVRVLHMLEHPEKPASMDVSGAIGIDASRVLLDDMVSLAEAQARIAQAKARTILAEAKRHLAAAGVSDVVIEQQHGALVDSIERFEAGADLVVIGKRGEHAAFARGHLGSNLERVIRSCRHPVLVAERDFKPIERVLIAFDGGPSVRKAIAHAVGSPLLKGLPVHLLSAGVPKPAIETELEAARIQLSDAGCAVTAELLSGSPEAVVAEAIKRLDISLLVMGAYGHSRIRQLIVGSTTTNLIRAEPVSLLVFR